MKNLSDRLIALRDRHSSYRSTHEMADALVPMIGHAQDMVERIKELETRDPGFWGRAAARQSERIKELEAELNEIREQGKDLPM